MEALLVVERTPLATKDAFQFRNFAPSWKSLMYYLVICFLLSNNLMQPGFMPKPVFFQLFVVDFILPETVKFYVVPYYSIMNS